MGGGIYQMNSSNALRVIWLARSVFCGGSVGLLLRGGA